MEEEHLHTGTKKTQLQWIQEKLTGNYQDKWWEKNQKEEEE